MNLEALRTQLKRHEGLRLHAYSCPTGHKTIGYGHNLEAHGQLHIDECTMEQAEAWLDEDIQDAIAVVKKFINASTWERMGDVRQRVLVDMAFAMGENLGQFKKMLRAVYEGRWLDAAASIRNSLFARQTGNRAVELERMMLNG